MATAALSQFCEEYGRDGMSVDPILLIHRQPDCYVTFHLIRDGDIVNDCAVKLSSLRDVFPEFRGEMERDFYFSLNSFYRPGQQGCGIAGLPRALRKAKTARYLNVFFVDIDCYKVGIESGTMAGQILTMQDHGLIPPISGMIRSGQGLWALWLLVDQPDGSGNVWLNPPYSQPDIDLFVKKMVKEVKAGHVSQAIMLTHNYTDTSWFHLAESCATLICFTRGRIKFVDEEDNACAPTQGQAFFYYGKEEAAFLESFALFGFIVKPTDRGV